MNTTPNITFLHLRNQIDTLPGTERTALLNKMIDNGIDLTEKEEQYLSTDDMKRYVDKLLERASHLNAYEVKFTDEVEKDIYFFTHGRGVFKATIFAYAAATIINFGRIFRYLVENFHFLAH